ncbi:MAG: 5-nitroimidazole antibiotic resistance protein, partial [Clostridiales bacterium]|nr:5-nitroimidazole antibiotic resistance protein [Clostridiales bacterium]
ESAVLFAEKYRPGNIEEARKRNERSLPGMAVLELKIEHMTGKKALR